jgi:DNA repair protein SbcC/Rad50
MNDLVNHDSNKAVIRVEFENHGHTYVVMREITKSGTSGELWEDGESKAIDSHVPTYVKNRAIGLDWEGFRKSTIILQGEMSALTDLDPGPRKEAFVQLFGLNFYTKLEDMAKGKARDKETVTYATEQANSILQSDVQKIPKTEQDLRQLGKSVRSRIKSSKQLEKSLQSKRALVNALENDHAQYIECAAKLDGLESMIADAEGNVTKKQGELNGILSIRRGFPTLKQTYASYTSLEAELSELRPTKAKYDKVITQIGKLIVALQGATVSLAKTASQIKRTRVGISGLKKQIPSSSMVSKAGNKLKKARDEEKRLKEEKGELRGKISGLDSLTKEQEAKKAQVKGKDKCPVCLQKISDPRHVINHYDQEISRLGIEKRTLEKKRQVSIKKLGVVSGLVARFEEAERNLRAKAALTSQVKLESKRLAGLRQDKVTGRANQASLRKQVGSLRTAVVELRFNPSRYRQLELKVRAYRRLRVAEKFANAETELNRLPQVKLDLEAFQAALTKNRDSKRSLQVDLRRLAKGESKYSRAKTRFDEVQNDYNKAESLLATEVERVRQTKRQLEELREKERTLHENLEKIKQLKNEIVILAELGDVFKNIPENILRRLRPFIEKEGTDIINGLSDSELTALNIEEDTLNVGATTNGEVRPIHYFSGGQKTRINMALRVAISRILSRMPQTDEHTFATMQTLFVDEGDFGNLDESGIRDAVNVIRNLTKEFDRVILISHVDAIREIFQGYTIEVRKTAAEESAILPVEVPVAN